MPQIKIFDRVYEVPSTFTLGELREIKKISGLNSGMIGEALEQGDPDVLAALVLITLRRNGEKVTLEDLDKVELSDIVFTGDDEEQEASAGPPAGAAGTAAPNGHSVTTPSGSGIPHTAGSR